MKVCIQYWMILYDFKTSFQFKFILKVIQPGYWHLVF